MYGAAESRALTGSQTAQLETFHNSCMRRTMGRYRGTGGPSTAELLDVTWQMPISQLLSRHRVRWLGHAQSVKSHRVDHMQPSGPHATCLLLIGLLWVGLGLGLGGSGWPAACLRAGGTCGGARDWNQDHQSTTPRTAWWCMTCTSTSPTRPSVQHPAMVVPAHLLSMPSTFNSYY